jgi:hypothetical protein
VPGVVAEVHGVQPESLAKPSMTSPRTPLVMGHQLCFVHSPSHDPRGADLAGILAGLPRFMRYAEVLRECFIDRGLYIGKERILAQRTAL